MTPEKIFQGITRVPLYLILLILPVFFLPFTNDWIEWNKHYALAILVVVSLLAWLAGGLISKKLTLYRAPFDIFLGVWWLVVVISAILSKDRIVSFLGPYENVSWSVLALALYILFALLVLWNMRARDHLDKMLVCFGAGGAFAALYFWLGRVGLWNFFKLPFLTWNPVAALNVDFGVFLVLIMVLSLGMLAVRGSSGKSERGRIIFWSIVALLSLVTIVALGFKLLWLMSAIGLCVLLVVYFARLEEVRYPVVSLVMVLFILSLVFVVLGTPRFLTLQTTTEVTPSHGLSWQITLDTLKEGARKMLFGSGPATFIYDFSTHRPQSFNNTPLWSVRFLRPAATMYQVLAETGILGLVAFLAVVFLGIGTAFEGWLKRASGKTKRMASPMEEMGGSAGSTSIGFFFALVAVWMMSLVSLFIITTGTIHWICFFGSLVLMILAGEQTGVLISKKTTLSFRTTPQYALVTSFIYIVVVASVVIGGIFLGRFYTADVLAVRAARAASVQKFDDAENLLGQVFELDPYRAEYPLQMASTLLLHAAHESQDKNSDPRYLAQLVSGAINASRQATSRAPLSVATWEQLAGIYAQARPFSKDANGWVINSLDESINLEPTNPQFYLTRGVAYLIDKKNDEAEADIRTAIKLKSDFVAAHYTLSNILENKKDMDGALAEAELVVQYAPQAIDGEFNLARLLYNRNKEGDSDRAEQIFRSILAVNKDYADALYSLALLDERKGNNDEARTLYKHVLDLDPNNQAVKDRLSALGGKKKK